MERRSGYTLAITTHESTVLNQEDQIPHFVPTSAVSEKTCKYPSASTAGTSASISRAFCTSKESAPKGQCREQG